MYYMFKKFADDTKLQGPVLRAEISSRMTYTGPYTVGQQEPYNDNRRPTGALADRKLSMSQSCALVVMTANGILVCINRNTVSRLREEIILLTCLFFRPHLEKSIQCRPLQYEKGIDKLQRVQRRSTIMVRGLQLLSQKERPRKLGLLTPDQRRLWEAGGSNNSLPVSTRRLLR